MFRYCVSMNTESINSSKYFIIFLIFRRNPLLIMLGNHWTYLFPDFTDNILRMLPLEWDWPKVTQSIGSRATYHYRSSLSFSRHHIPQVAFPQAAQSNFISETEILMAWAVCQALHSLEHGRHCPHTNSVRQVLFLSPFYRFKEKKEVWRSDIVGTRLQDK